MNRLDEICAVKRDHIERRKQACPLKVLEARLDTVSAPRGFVDALKKARRAGSYGLIAEVKKASPSKGLIRADFDPPALARAYQAGGATCLSVLTDAPYFQGDDAFLGAARGATDLACLRKDFMLDPYQIIESRALGADCVLIILAALSNETATALIELAHDLDMDTLVEIHDADELDRALALPGRIIGINNRNLKSLAVELATTLNLAPRISDDRLVVAESGLARADDLAACAAIGVTSFLIGEALMRQNDVESATRALLATKDIEVIH